MSLSSKDSVARGNILSSRDLVIIGASALVTSTLVELLAADGLSSREIPVVTAMVKGQSVLGLGVYEMRFVVSRTIILTIL